MTHLPQEAVEAAARVMKPRQFEPNYTPLGMWSDLEQMHEIAELDRDMTRDRVRDILTAAEPHLRRKWAEELVERIGASNLGAPLRIDPDGTFRMANGPEMRALLCEFILEAARRAR